MTQNTAEQREKTELEKRHFNYITANHFYVEMEGVLTASFTECSGLEVQIEKEVYLEGGVNDQQRIFLKQTKFSDITLKRGMTNDLGFWDWLELVFKLNESKKSDDSSSSSAQNSGDGTKGKLRRNISILMFNQAGETMRSWNLIGAVPVSWKTPNLQADASSVAIEELTLAYEGLQVERKPSGNPSWSDSKPRNKTGYFT